MGNKSDLPRWLRRLAKRYPDKSLKDLQQGGSSHRGGHTESPYTRRRRKIRKAMEVRSQQINRFAHHRKR